RGIRARLRGRLGGAAGVARAVAAAVGAGAGAATAAGRRALVAARGETARRLGRLAALTVVLAALVMVLYDHGDVPTAAARGASGGAPGSATNQPEGPAARGGPAAHGGPAAAPGGPADGRKAPADPGRAAGAQARPGGRAAAGTAGGHAAPGAAGGRPVKRSAGPAEVAAAWYAARQHLPRSRVRPLQQDRIAAGQVRVLVLAEASGGRLRTALGRLRLGPSGWEVW
ncbi:MAG TPA: hypothetical protein VF880_08245, partial [Actinomycetes bacterium]